MSRWNFLINSNHRVIESWFANISTDKTAGDSRMLMSTDSSLETPITGPGMNCIKIGPPGKGPILLKILSENWFSRKTYFNSIASRDADQSDSQFSTFNYTIMAAGDAQDDGDGRILYFSTPIDTGRGRGVFGTDQDDNRRKHIETRYIIYQLQQHRLHYQRKILGNEKRSSSQTVFSQGSILFYLPSSLLLLPS